MNQERDPFELSALPPVTPPGDVWPGISHALQQRAAQQQRRRRVSTTWLGMAAGVTLAIGLAFQLSRSAPDPQAEPATVAGATPSAAPKAVTAQDNLEALIGLSQQLERNVRMVRSEIDAMPAQSVVYQIELEDLVAQVDDALSIHPDSRELWSQRVNLLLDLEQLYQRELRRDDSYMASL